MKQPNILAHRGSIEAFKFERLEKNTGFELPESYKIFLSENDVPWLAENHFKFKNTFFKNRERSFDIKDGNDSRDLNFLSFNDSPYGDGILDCQDFDGRAPSSIVVFGCSANGDYICFDYGLTPTPDEPKIVLMFHDAFDEKGQMLICHVANDFEDFMNGLN
jgi:hypothetical protein